MGHVARCRAPALGGSKPMAMSLLAGIVTSALLCAPGPEKSRHLIDAGGVGIAILLFCSWWFIFFLNFVQAMESSIRVNLLREMRAGGGSMSRAQLADRYNDARLVRLRLDRLRLGGGAIAVEGRAAQGDFAVESTAGAHIQGVEDDIARKASRSFTNDLAHHSRLQRGRQHRSNDRPDPTSGQQERPRGLRNHCRRRWQ